jgi:dephospho-CoA kinase
MATPLAPGTGGRGSPWMESAIGHPVVVAYRADWPRRAAVLIATLREQLGVRAERIEHIGSTAIPGMAAKDVLDLQVSVGDLDTAARAFDEPLAALGFRRTPYERDHIPAGLADDPGRWAKRLWSRREHPDGDVNLQVRLTGSPGERLALLFRDWFRVHSEAVPAYASFKRSLAAITPGVDVYSDIKDPVVDLVISVAEAWASSTGWQS